MPYFVSASPTKQWWIAGDGHDQTNCGSRELPCQGLGHVINISLSGDQILIQNDRQVPMIFHFCSTISLDKSLSIIGIGKGIVQLTCPLQNNSFGGKYIFWLQNSTMYMKNIFFESGYILAENSTVSFENCTFDQTALFLMDKDVFFNYYIQNNFHSQQGLFKTNLKDIIREKKNVTCHKISLKFRNTIWGHVDNSLGRVKPLNHLNLDGIQVVCKQVNIEIEDSYLANREIAIVTTDQLDLRISTTKFEGHGGTIVQGGLHIYSAGNLNINVEDSIFHGLKYYDMVSAQLAVDIILVGAFTIESIYRSNDTINVNIEMSVFERNLRGMAISIKNADEIFCHEGGMAPRHVINVSDCTFKDNEIISDGGAVWLSDGDETIITFQSCSFIGNKAGVQGGTTPLNISLNIVGKPVQQKLPPSKTFQWKSKIQNLTTLEDIQLTARGVEFMGENDLKIILEPSVRHYDYENHKEDRQLTNQAVTIDLGTSGGAIMIFNFHTAIIKNCSFSGNSVNNYGGSLYFAVLMVHQDPFFLFSSFPQFLVIPILLQDIT